MIKRVTDINSLSGVLSPLLPLICTDHLFSCNSADGAFIQLDENDNITAVLSLKNGSATITKTNFKVDLKELETFLKVLGVLSVVSDFSLENEAEKCYPLLKCNPYNSEKNDVCVLSEKSSIAEYKTVFDMLSDSDGDFENWFPSFSKKINQKKAMAVYKAVDGVAVSTATATAVYNKTAIISGVFTSENYRKKGYASSCIKSFLSELYHLGVREAYLWCEERNLSFYNKLGFINCGEVYVREEF